MGCRQVKSDVVPGAQPRIMMLMCTQWTEICRCTLESALNTQHLVDIIKNVEDPSEILAIHIRFLVATTRRFLEFGLLYQAFPWRFFLLLSQDKELTESTLASMRVEWDFLLKVETSGQCYRKWPLNSIPHLLWFAYREVMTAAEESKWAMTEELQQRVQAYFPEPCSTLGADAIFRNQRFGETKNMKNEVSVEQLMASAAKALNERYKEFAVPNKLDFHGISPSQFLKRSVFDASRASATDTGLQNFNQMVRAPTISPHHLTRKSLNLWFALKSHFHKRDSFWTAQLVRSGQVLLFYRLLVMGGFPIQNCI